MSQWKEGVCVCVRVSTIINGIRNGWHTKPLTGWKWLEIKFDWEWLLKLTEKLVLNRYKLQNSLCCVIFLLSFSPLPRYDKGLCFSNCLPGYIGAGKLCWSLISAQRKIVQGEGTAADACPPEKPSKEGGLCYRRCLRGWTGDGPVCRKEWVRNFSHWNERFICLVRGTLRRCEEEILCMFLSRADQFDQWVKKPGLCLSCKLEKTKRKSVSSGECWDIISSGKLCGKHSDYLLLYSSGQWSWPTDVIWRKFDQPGS